MSRRVVSLLLVPCVLLAQSAIALSHSHGGNEPAGHGTRAHVHIGNHAHDHGHDDGHHHHHKEHGDTSKPPHPPSSCPRPISDHDSDAVYISQIDAVIGANNPVENAWAASLSWAPVVSITAPFDSPIRSRHLANWIHAPPSGCDDPLYLCHLALLL